MIRKSGLNGRFFYAKKWRDMPSKWRVATSVHRELDQKLVSWNGIRSIANDTTRPVRRNARVFSRGMERS